MKLHWVELENWRQHTKTKIDFDEDTTVIYGPNETGKSTIFEALSKGFFDKSSTHAEAIKRVKPHTAPGNVTSTVRIKFTLNKTRYRVEKNFNLRRGTSLYKIDDESSTLLAQDNSADEKLIQLLEAELPSTRGSKPSQWGAFHWLWAPQENRKLPTDKDGDPTTSLHLETKNGEGLLVTPKFQSVQNSVQTYYALYFTKTGRSTTDSPISNHEKEIQDLQHRSIEFNDKIIKVDNEKQRLEELEKQLPIHKKKIIETKEELEKARSEAIDFSSIESELKASEAGVREEERNVDDAKKALTEFEKSSEKIEKFQKKEKETRENLYRLEALCETLEKRQQEIKKQVEEKAMKIRACEELTKDARILWTKSDSMKKIEDIKKKIEKIKDLNKKTESLRKKEVPIVPTDEEIEAIIQSQMRIETLNESLKARGLAVNIIPGKEGSLEVEVDGEIIKDEKLTATGTESVSVGAPGFGRVTVKAKLKQAHDAKVDILRLEGSIQSELSKYTVNSIGKLKELNRTQKEISNGIKELDAEKRGVDERSINEITLDFEKIKEKYEEDKKIERTPNAIKSNPTDVDLAELIKKREKEHEEAKAILDEARADRDEIDEELIKEKEKLAGIRAEQKHISDDLESSRTHEREIIRQYGSSENQEKILKDAKKNFKKKKEEYEKIEKQYEELIKGPINRIKRLEQQIDNQEQVIRQQQTYIDQLKGGIGTASLGGAYSELAVIESRIEILSERLEKERIRSESYKLLKEELEQQYHLALSVVVGPIQEVVKHSLSYVTGFLHEDVELNEYLLPIRLGESCLEDISLVFDDSSLVFKELFSTSSAPMRPTSITIRAFNAAPSVLSVSTFSRNNENALRVSGAFAETRDATPGLIRLYGKVIVRPSFSHLK